MDRRLMARIAARTALVLTCVLPLTAAAMDASPGVAAGANVAAVTPHPASGEKVAALTGRPFSLAVTVASGAVNTCFRFYVNPSSGVVRESFPTDGLSFNTATGVISGTPIAPTTLQITCALGSTWVGFTLNVIDQATFVPAALSTLASLSAKVGDPVSYWPIALGTNSTNGTQGSLPLTLVNSLPAGLTWDGTTITGSIRAKGTWLVDFTANQMGITSTVSVLITSESQSQLQSASCVRSDWCIAVGKTTDADGRNIKSLIELWDGQTWWLMSSPDVGLIDSVSCTSVEFCVAAGRSALTWDGLAWTVPTALPGEAGGVQCTSPTFCMIVGRSGWTMTFDGQSWLHRDTPDPTWTLAGVTCTSQSNCVAVGNINNTGYIDNARTLVVRWDGSGWDAERSPSAASGGSQLRSVSCSEADFCMATGFSIVVAPSLHAEAIAERWDGSSWSMVLSPSIQGSSTTALLGISCTGPDACTTSGLSMQGVAFSTARNLVERWDGSSWTFIDSPSAAGVTGDWLSSISCTSSIDCTTVGYHGGTFCDLCVTGRGANGQKPHGLDAARASARALRLPRPRAGISTSAQALLEVGGNWSVSATGVSFSSMPLKIGEGSLPPATRGVPYSFTLRSGGGTSPFAWKKVGTWPAGLSISKAGVIHGTPRLSLAIGNYALSVSESDSTKPTKLTTTATFTLSVS